ncbi:MAG: SH3 domain-containing protein [Saprospiraceae bacterium]|nr:SH3 domain-containing protein [Saprospiraceae bacterium]
MKKNILIFGLLSFFAINFSQANTEPSSNKVHYAEGDRLFSWASFLNLRSEPHQDAKVLAMIPRGSVIQILMDQTESRTHKVALVPDYAPSEDSYTYHKGESLHGNWVQVEYEGLQGYVFDGYLSKIIPIRSKKGDSPGDIFTHYLLDHYQGAVITEPGEEEIFDEKVVTPKGNLTYTHFFNYDCEVFELDMHGVMLQEALMIMTKVFRVDGISHREDGKYFLVNKDDPYSNLVVEKTEEGSRISIWWCEGC